MYSWEIEKVADKTDRTHYLFSLPEKREHQLQHGSVRDRVVRWKAKRTLPAVQLRGQQCGDSWQTDTLREREREKRGRRKWIER